MNSIKIIVGTILSVFFFSSNTQANWCDGTKFGILKMSRSERIEQAAQTVNSEHKRLEEIANHLNHDIRYNIVSLRDELHGENSKLAQKTKDLCTVTRKKGYTNMQYDGITLKTEAEITAQMRMNLAAIQANESSIDYLDRKKIAYQNLMDKILAKFNEMAVLKKRFANLIDPRDVNRGATFNDTIANTCVAIDKSEKLRMTYTQSTREQLFQKAAQYSKTKTISPDLLNAFKSSCNLSLQWSVAGSGLNK